MDEPAIAMVRETDRWLRKWSLIAPVVAYIVGTMTGFASATWLYHDHEKRISSLEDWHRVHDKADREVDGVLNSRLRIIESRQDQVRTVIDDKFKIRIQ